MGMSTYDFLHSQSDEDRNLVLMKLVNRHVGRPLNNRTLSDIDETDKRYGEHLRAHGVDFPQLVAFFLPTRGHLDLVRRDLDEAGIQQVLKNAIVRFPDIRSDELVPALRAAWPDYKHGVS